MIDGLVGAAAAGSNETHWFGCDLKGPDSCVMWDGTHRSPSSSNIPEQSGRDIERYVTRKVRAGATSLKKEGENEVLCQKLLLLQLR